MTGWNNDTIRRLERGSIRDFVESCTPQLAGRVLDYGCGSQPYRDLVEQAGGVYLPYDLGDQDWRPGGPYDAILVTQVMQYLADPAGAIEEWRDHLRPRGWLVVSYATNWDEVEPHDLWRFTKAGMERMMEWARFEVVRHQRRADVALGGFRFPLGYGLLARRIDEGEEDG